MILSLLLLAQAVSPATPDVVVTAERLHKLRLATSVQDGRLAGCAVRVSSGDQQIDFEACHALRQCFQQGATGSETLANCVDASLAAYVRDRAATAAEDK